MRFLGMDIFNADQGSILDLLCHTIARCNILRLVFGSSNRQRRMKMKKLICLCGISGVGKTWERTHNPRFVDLPYVDIADSYKNLKTSDYIVAWNDFVDRINKAFQTSNAVVAEAAFTSNQKSKILFTMTAVQVEIIDLPRPSKQVLLDRVKESYEQSEKTPADKRYYDARVSMINNLG
jgi:hypothetical protein